MTIIQVKYFLEVCKWSSISKASGMLHVSQPTVSVSIHNLEKETGLNLFKREGKQLLLTEEGELVRSKLGLLLESFDHVNEEIRDISKNKNYIKLAIPLQIGVGLLPKILGEFKCQHPEIQLDIVESGGIDSLQMIEEGTLDLAVTNYDDHFSNDLQYMKLKENEICFCISKSNPMAFKKEISLKEASAVPLVMLNGGFFINRVIHAAWQNQRLSPHVILNTSQLHTVKNLVVHDLAATFLMKQAILPDEPIQIIPLVPKLFIHSGIVTKKGRQIYSDEKKLIEFIRRQAVGI